MSRINRAIKLIKLAAAKSKIQRYSIASPSVKFFIHRYEDAIPWDEAEKVKQSGGSVDSYIQEFIKTSILPSLGKKIDPKSSDNNFMPPEAITDEDVVQEIIATEEAQGRVPRGNYTPAQIQGGRDMIVHDIITVNQLHGIIQLHIGRIGADGIRYLFSFHPVIDSNL